MASNSLQTLHSYHHRNPTTSSAECHHFRNRRHSLDNTSSAPKQPPNPSLTGSSSSSSQFLKPYHITTKPKPSPISSLTAAFSTTTTPTPPSPSSSDTSSPTFDALRRHLTTRSFREADEETRRLLIQLAGDAAQKRGYVFFSEVQFISGDDLRAIDALWREHSDGRYGYSVQRKVWKKCKGDFTRFFIKVGWMKKLEGSEVDQYNYRSFPGEFMWEVSDDAPPPEGHLPLTNALRGTQLLSCILNHPAFVEMEEGEDEGRQSNPFTTPTAPTVSGTTGSSDSKKKPPGNHRLLKPDYSF